MKKAAFAAVLLAGIVGWAIRDDASSKPSAAAPAATPGARPSREQLAQRVKDNEPLRARLQKQHPDAWRDLAKQTRRDIATCVVTEFMPGVLKADCL